MLKMHGQESDTPKEFDTVKKGWSSLVTRFWSSVAVGSSDECWKWQKSLTVRGGYGQLMWWDGLTRRLVKAHQLSFFLHHGVIPEGRMVCHKCNTPACCNPHHLYAGTALDNWNDNVVAGTASHLPHVQGESCGKSKLTDATVVAIRMSDLKGTELATKYGVSKANITAIRKGRTWRHLL